MGGNVDFKTPTGICPKIDRLQSSVQQLQKLMTRNKKASSFSFKTFHIICSSVHMKYNFLSTYAPPKFFSVWDITRSQSGGLVCRPASLYTFIYLLLNNITPVLSVVYVASRRVLLQIRTHTLCLRLDLPELLRTELLVWRQKARL